MSHGFGRLSRWACGLIALVLVCVGGGCARSVTMDDPGVRPLLAAMEKVDRTALGFTPIEKDAKIRLEGRGQGYDAMLHVYGSTSRTIAFRKTESGYRWVHEQETHQGPGWQQTVDGVFREGITITYQTEPFSGSRTNELRILYFGPDQALRVRNLALTDVQQILEQWKNAPADPKPPPHPNEEGFNLFLFSMMMAFLLACVLALVVGAVAALVLLVMMALLAGLIAAGMVSASVVIGALRRSVSTGFRALFLQIGGVFGLIMGSLGAWVFILLAKLPMSSTQPWVIGPLAGIAFGLLAAWMFNFAWGRSVEWIARTLPRRKVVEVEGEKVVNGD